MQLIIIAVGQRMPPWVDEAFAEYAKRMPPELKMVLHEVKPELRSSSRNASQIMSTEAERIRALIPKKATVVALDEHGRDMTTAALAHSLELWRSSGGDVVFLVGGADGLDASLKTSSALQLRLSSLTLPHGMARVVLAEQLYRAWTVTQNHPYHRV